MRASWDDPFGKIEAHDPIRYEIRHAFKTSAGIFVARNTVHIGQLKEDQERLVPYFQPLQGVSEEMLWEADQVTRNLSKREVVLHTIYRRPDQPGLLQDFQLQITGHYVTLNESGKKSHPLVEQLFPLKHFQELTDDEKKALTATVQFKLCRKKLDPREVPQYIRIVFPEMIKHIIHWIQNIDAPINGFGYFVRPPNRGEMRHAVYDKAFN